MSELTKTYFVICRKDTHQLLSKEGEWVKTMQKAHHYKAMFKINERTVGSSANFSDLEWVRVVATYSVTRPRRVMADVIAKALDLDTDVIPTNQPGWWLPEQDVALPAEPSKEHKITTQDTSFLSSLKITW